MEDANKKRGTFVDSQIQEVINQKRKVNKPIKHLSRQGPIFMPPLFYCCLLESDSDEKYYFTAAKRLIELGASLTHQTKFFDYKINVLDIAGYNKFPGKQIPSYILQTLDSIKKRELLDGIVSHSLYTALCKVILLENIDFARFLILNGASVNIRDKDGGTPIFHALKIEDKDLRLKALSFIEMFGIDLTIENKNNETILDCCSKKKLEDEKNLITKILQERTDRWNLFKQLAHNSESYISKIPKELVFLTGNYILHCDHLKGVR